CLQPPVGKASSAAPAAKRVTPTLPLSVASTPTLPIATNTTTQVLPSQAAPTLPITAVTPVTPLDCRCVVCTSDHVQRVSAIVKSGKWSAERNWSDSSHWAENSKSNNVSNLGG